MWDERYAKAEFAYGTEPNDFLRDMADRLPQGRVLCLAEGQGRNAVFLAGRGHRVTAVDGSAVGLARAQELAASRGVEIRTLHADLADHDFGKDWDAIVCIFGHFPPALRLHVLRSAVQALRPGGALLMEVYSKAQLGRDTGGPQVADMLYDLGELHRELADLHLEIASEQEREVHEGPHHKGLACTIQILGFKR